MNESTSHDVKTLTEYVIEHQNDAKGWSQLGLPTHSESVARTLISDHRRNHPTQNFRLVERITQTRVMDDMEWQVIDTAPRDGTPVLAWFPKFGHMVAVFCDYDSVNNSGGWAVGFEYYGPAPTHWLPLPLPPAS